MSLIARTSPDTGLNHHLRNHPSLGPGSWTESLRQEIPLHLQLSGLLVQPCNQRGSLFGFLVLAAAEDTRGSRQQGLLLGLDLTGMGFVPLSPTLVELLFEVFSQRYEGGTIREIRTETPILPTTSFY